MSSMAPASAHSRGFDRDLLLLLALALAKLIFHVATNGQYGFHRDELQTLSDARHLDWGYVAYPPLTPFLGRVGWELFGNSLAGFRFFSAFAQSIVVVLAGLTARQMGARRGAMLLAAIVVALTPISLFSSGILQYNAFDLLAVVSIGYFLVRRIESDDPRWWLAIGAAIGFGVLAKYTMGIFGVALVAGVLLTPLRRDLATRWPWFGAAIAILMFLPNLLWQAQHHFVYLDFVKHIHARDVAIGRAASFWKDQLIVGPNPFFLPFLALGLYRLFANPAARQFRVLAWMAVFSVGLFALAQGRGYYTAPVYPMLLVSGVVQMQAWLGARGHAVRRVGWTIAILLPIMASGLAALLLPLAPVHSRYWDFVIAKSPASYDFREQFGWPELARENARIWQTLTSAEREHAVIYASNYGEAGALELYGPRYGLPQVVSATNTFWFRGAGDPAAQAIIVNGSERKDWEPFCDSLELAGHTSNDAHVANEETQDHPDIFVCHGVRKPLVDRWPKLPEFG